MRLVTMAAWIFLGAAPSLLAQNAGKATKAPPPAGPAIKCKGPDASPCNARQVQVLADAVEVGRAHHEVLNQVRSVTLASSDGTLKCEQTDGKPCTTAQLDLVKQFGNDQKLYINYNAAK